MEENPPSMPSNEISKNTSCNMEMPQHNWIDWIKASEYLLPQALDSLKQVRLTS